MRPETRLQREIRKYLMLHGFKSVACSNGAVLAGGPKQRAIQMNTLKSAGLTPGYPDLIVYGPDQRIGHLEVKTPEGDLSAAQVACHKWLREFGQVVAVVTSLDEVKAALEGWGWLK